MQLGLRISIRSFRSLGVAPESGPCDPFSAHGYFGKESETVEQIVNWMLKKPFGEEIR